MNVGMAVELEADAAVGGLLLSPALARRLDAAVKECRSCNSYWCDEVYESCFLALL